MCPTAYPLLGFMFNLGSFYRLIASTVPTTPVLEILKCRKEVCMGLISLKAAKLLVESILLVSHNSKLQESHLESDF